MLCEFIRANYCTSKGKKTVYKGFKIKRHKNCLIKQSIFYKKDRNKTKLGVAMFTVNRSCDLLFAEFTKFCHSGANL